MGEVPAEVRSRPRTAHPRREVQGLPRQAPWLTPTDAPVSVVTGANSGIGRACIAAATDPSEVGAVIHHAITTDDPTLRYSVSWGGSELVDGRARISDADWVEVGGIDDDAAYYDRFAQLFGLAIAPD